MHLPIGHSSMSDIQTDYDALLVISFGGPEGPEDVIPFLENVLRGRNVPVERMIEVAEHYQAFGGVSPINGNCRALVSALQTELATAGLQLPVYWGNRNWHPMLADTLRQMRDDGIKRALAFVTSAYSSWSSCRQYLGDIEQARREVGDGAPQIDKLRTFYNHPGFIEPMRDSLKSAAQQIDDSRHPTTVVVYTAHSIPTGMADGCAYQAQLEDACGLVAETVPQLRWQLVYQSRSGPPTQPWLEPDICDHLHHLHREGNTTDVIVCPIGFTSDHMEVLFDLDTEAQQKCDQLGIRMLRTPTAGTDPRFIRMICDLSLERISSSDQLSLGERGPGHDVCPADCCPSGQPTGPPSD